MVTDLQQKLVLCDSLDGFNKIITDGHSAADLMLDFLQTDGQKKTVQPVCGSSVVIVHNQLQLVL